MSKIVKKGRSGVKAEDLVEVSSPARIVNSVDKKVSALKPKFIDHSVNAAKIFVDHHGHLILESSIQTNASGNFNGGGTGNKPIASVIGFGGLPMAQFPKIASEVSLRTSAVQAGLSYNAFIDLHGDGSVISVMVITNTLGGNVDKYGETGQSASMTDFDISSDPFYIVGDLPDFTGTGSWTSHAITLDTLLNGDGGDYPVGYPNAKLVECTTAEDCVATDGGLGEGTVYSAITAQFGGSGNNDRIVTAVTELTFDDTKLI